jgi:phage gp45-like
MGNAINRVTIDKTNDDPYMQEVGLRGYNSEGMDDIEHFHPYGFSARVRPPSKGKDGIERKAEGVMVFVTGNRSHGLLVVVGDRRYRLNGLQEGEMALHDDQGHQVHLTRDGIVISAPNSKKIVTQLMKDDQMPQASGQKYGQTKQAGREADATLTLTKDGYTISHKQKISYMVGQSTLTLLPDKITLETPTISNKVSARFETIGKTVLGIDSAGEDAPLSETNTIPYKQTFVKLIT